MAIPNGIRTGWFCCTASGNPDDVAASSSSYDYNCSTVLEFMCHLSSLSQVLNKADPLEVIGSESDRKAFCELKNVLNLMANADPGEIINLFPFLKLLSICTGTDYMTTKNLSLLTVWDDIVKLILVVIPPMRELFLGLMGSPLEVPGWLSLASESRCFNAMYSSSLTTLEDIFRDSLGTLVVEMPSGGSLDNKSDASGSVDASAVEGKSPSEDAACKSFHRSNAMILKRSPAVFVVTVDSAHLSNGSPRAPSAVKFPLDFDMVDFIPLPPTRGKSSSKSSTTTTPMIGANVGGGKDMDSSCSCSNTSAAAQANRTESYYTLSFVSVMTGDNLDIPMHYHRTLYVVNDDEGHRHVDKWYRCDSRNVTAAPVEVDVNEVVQGNFFSINESGGHRVHPTLLIYTRFDVPTVLDRTAHLVSKAGQMKALGDVALSLAMTTHNYSEARRCYEEAISIDPSMKSTIQENCNALDKAERTHKARLLEEQADLALANRRFREASELYSRAMLSAVVGSGVYLWAREKLEYITRIITLDATCAVVEKGTQCLIQGSYEPAREYVTTAFKSNPELIHLHSIVTGIDHVVQLHHATLKVTDGHTAIKNNKFKLARQLFHEAIALDAEKIAELADLMKQLGPLILAEEGRGKHRLGQTAMEEKKYHDAIALYDVSIDSFRNNCCNDESIPSWWTQDTAMCYADRGWAHLELKDLENALLDFNAAIGMQKDLGIAHYRSGVCYFALERLDDATTFYENAAMYDSSLTDQVKVKMRQVNTAKEVKLRKEREAERIKLKEEEKIALEEKRLRDEKTKKEKAEKALLEKQAKLERNRIKEEEKAVKAQLEKEKAKIKESEKERLRAEKAEKDAIRAAEREKVRLEREVERERLKQEKEKKAQAQKLATEEEKKRQSERAADLLHAEQRIKQAEREKELEKERKRVEIETIIAARDKARKDKNQKEQELQKHEQKKRVAAEQEAVLKKEIELKEKLLAEQRSMDQFIAANPLSESNSIEFPSLDLGAPSFVPQFLKPSVSSNVTPRPADECLQCRESFGAAGSSGSKLSALGSCNHRGLCGQCVYRHRGLRRNFNCPLCLTANDVVICSPVNSNLYSSYNLPQTPASTSSLYYDSISRVYFPWDYYQQQISPLLTFSCGECKYTDTNVNSFQNHLFTSHNLGLCSNCVLHNCIYPARHVSYTVEQLKAHLKVCTGSAAANTSSGSSSAGTDEKVNLFESSAVAPSPVFNENMISDNKYFTNNSFIGGNNAATASTSSSSFLNKLSNTPLESSGQYSLNPSDGSAFLGSSLLSGDVLGTTGGGTSSLLRSTSSGSVGQSSATVSQFGNIGGGLGGLLDSTNTASVPTASRSMFDFGNGELNSSTAATTTTNSTDLSQSLFGGLGSGHSSNSLFLDSSLSPSLNLDTDINPMTSSFSSLFDSPPAKTAESLPIGSGISGGNFAESSFGVANTLNFDNTFAGSSGNAFSGNGSFLGSNLGTYGSQSLSSIGTSGIAGGLFNSSVPPVPSTSSLTETTTTPPSNFSGNFLSSFSNGSGGATVDGPFARAAGVGMDNEVLPDTYFPVVAWLEKFNMSMYRWSGDNSEWVEFGMHVPSDIVQYLTGRIMTGGESFINNVQQRTSCRMRMEKEQLNGQESVFLVFHKGAASESSNTGPLYAALEAVSHHMMEVFAATSSANSSSLSSWTGSSSLTSFPPLAPTTSTTPTTISYSSVAAASTSTSMTASKSTVFAAGAAWNAAAGSNSTSPLDATVFPSLGSTPSSHTPPIDGSDAGPSPQEDDIANLTSSYAIEESDLNGYGSQSKTHQAHYPRAKKPDTLKVKTTGSNGFVHRALEVPRDAVGLVIGQAGKKIKELCQQSGAKLQFRVNKAAEKEGRPGMLEIQGAMDNVDTALQLVWDMLQMLGREYVEVPLSKLKQAY